MDFYQLNGKHMSAWVKASCGRSTLSLPLWVTAPQLLKNNILMISSVCVWLGKSTDQQQQFTGGHNGAGPQGVLNAETLVDWGVSVLLLQTRRHMLTWRGKLPK